MRFPPHKTKIVCTIGPASDQEKVLERMIRKGMNVARLNLAHGDSAGQAQAIKRIRTAAKKLGRRVAILADLPGPKIRVGKLAEEPVDLIRGEEVVLTSEQLLGDATRISVSFPGFDKAVRPGDVIFLNDGFIRLRVREAGEGEVRCRVIEGGPLRSYKGVNLPGVDLGMSAVTQNDLHLLAFAMEHGVDAVSVSFVRGPEDIETVRQATAERGYASFVIAKIERAVAIRRFRDILEAADGIMVARGDLGVETPIEEIAVLQKNLIHRANLVGKPVITATQMLESMTENSRPTRAEATDVANAILDGTDAVMLSEESAVGAHAVEAVGMLARIARATEANRLILPLSVAVLRGTSQNVAVEEAIALDVVSTADRLRPRLILTPTQTGETARRISRYKLRPWIVTFSPSEATCQQLLFSYGVFPARAEEDGRGWKAIALDWCRQHGIHNGLAVMTQGGPRGRADSTNRLEVFSLAESTAD